MKCILSGANRFCWGLVSAGYPSANIENTFTFSGSSRRLCISSIRSSIGAIPNHTPPRPSASVSSQIFCCAIAISICAKDGATSPSVWYTGTITTGAPAAHPVYGVTLDNFWIFFICHHKKFPRLLVTCTWCLHSRLQNLHDFFRFYWSIFIFSYTDSVKNTVHITWSLAYYLR